MSGKGNERSQLSPAERGETNVAKLRAYLDGLRRSGLTVPTNSDGEPNRTAIAKASGIRRNVLHTNKTAIRLLAEFTSGGDDHATGPRTEARASVQATQISVLEQQVLRLEQRLAVVTAERDELRKRLSQYRVIEEDVLKKGRRLIP